MMSSARPSQTSLFGIELADLWASLTRPWRNLHRSGGLAWLAPPVQVRLIQVDGRESVWEGDRQVTGTVAAGIPFVAAELPEDLYLRRSLALPPMEEADLENAIALDIESASPFGTQDLVWGYRARIVEGQQRVDVAFASRRQITEYLHGLRSRLPDDAVPEVWARTESGDPIVLRGYGEDRRARHIASRWKVGVALVVLAAALATAAAVTPTAQLRLRAAQAVQAHDEAVKRAQPLLAKREKAVQAGADVAALNTLIAQSVDAAYAIDYLTRIIPDDTYLISLNIQGNKVVLIGHTANSATLMQRLSGEPGLRDVRAPSPAIRPPGSTKETFTVEFTFDARPAASAAPPSTVIAPAPVAVAPARVDTLGAAPQTIAPPAPAQIPQAAAPQAPTPAPPPAAAPAPAPVAAQPAPGSAAPSPFVIGGTVRPRAPAAPASAPRATP